MRKLFTLACAITMMAVTLVLVGCAGAGTGSSQSGASESSASQSGASQSDSSQSKNEEGTDMTSTTTTGSKTLVAYFSATGTTKGLAQTIAEVTGGDLYEITPAEPYTSADLDYNDSSSRTTIEQNDSSSRPAISGAVEDFDQYDTVFVGYPIWWYDAPRIMYTFAESYDFAGKTVVPFCTSGGSGIGSSGSNLAAAAGTGTWLDGARMSGDASASEVSEWVQSLGV